MDIEKLIEDLRIACAGNQHNIMGVAATALSTLQAENEKLRDKLERVTAERDAAISDMVFITRTYPVELCDDLVCKFCVHFPNAQTGCLGWEKNECFEWRGIKKED